MTREHLSGVLWMVASSVLFSVMSLLVRVAGEVPGLNAWKTTEFRFLISIIVVVAISKLGGKPLRFVNKRWLVSRGILGAGAVYVFFYTINETGMAKATILNYTYPIWAGLFTPLFLRERVRPGLWGAVVVSFGGLYLVIVPAGGFGLVSWINLLAVCGGVLSGWAVLSIKKLSETDSSRAILFAQAFFGLLLVGVPAQVGGYSKIPLSGWGVLLAVGLVAAIAQLQMTYAYKHVGATEGSLLSMLTPVLNAVMGLLVFHEPVSMRALAGCAIVLAGCSYAAIPPRVPQAVAEAEGVGRPT